MKFGLFRHTDRNQADPVPPTSRPDVGGELIVYGTAWCGDCLRSHRFLDRHSIPYRWIDVDHDATAIARILEINRGKRSVPTIVFPDGSTLTEPSNAELARKLGIVG